MTALAVPTKEKDHRLALKVMRLTKPTLSCDPVILTSSSDISGPALESSHLRQLTSVPDLPHLSLGNLLLLPQNFGNIFLGETFSCYVSVHNDGEMPCHEVSVKADLQTSSQRLPLSTNKITSCAELAAGKSLDDVILHQVKELGTHILVCAVNYSCESDEKLYFRKFFKFQVLKPLDVKTKFYNAESDEVYLEAQIQNITPAPILMERVFLETSPQYCAQSLNHNAQQPHIMSSLDVRQFLYRLQPRPELSNDSRLLKGLTNIGKLDIVWKTAMGEKGRLQTSALQRSVTSLSDLRSIVESVPEVVECDETFQLNVKITNCTDRSMELVLRLENHIESGLQWCGTSGKPLGQLAANSSLTLTLSVKAVRSGLHAARGLQLHDLFRTRTYELDQFVHVFVDEK